MSAEEKEVIVMTSMTITRALSELKTLKKNIDASTTELNRNGGILFIGQLEGTSPAAKDQAGRSREELERLLNSNFQSTAAIVDRYLTIRSLVVASNAATMIEVAGKQMTIAAAIEYKKLIDFKVALMKRLLQEKMAISKSVANRRELINQQVDAYATNMANSTSGTSANASPEAQKALDDMRKQAIESFRQTKEAGELFVAVDPLNIEEKANEIRKELDELTVELDSKITVCNSTTLISLPA